MDGSEQIETSEKVDYKKNPRTRKQKKEKVEKEEDLKYIAYFYRPHLVSSLWKLDLEEGDNPDEL